MAFISHLVLFNISVSSLKTALNNNLSTRSPCTAASFIILTHPSSIFTTPLIESFNSCKDLYLILHLPLIFLRIYLSGLPVLQSLSLSNSLLPCQPLLIYPDHTYW